MSAPADGMSVPDAPASVDHGAVEAARAAQDGAAARHRLAQRRLERSVDAAVAGRGDDDAGAAGVDERANRARVGAGAARHDGDPGPRRGVARQAIDAEPGGCALRPGPERTQAAFLDARDRSGVARAEGVEAIRVDLADVERRVDGAGDDDDDAARTGRGRHRDGVGQVLRAVGEARGRRPHRCREDDRLGRREHALQEVRRLLERVGAVGDDDRRDLGPREVAGDAPGERAPGGEVHVLAVELRDLLALDGDAGRDRQRGDERRHRQRRRPIGDVVVGRRGAAGDRAAGAEDDEDSGGALHSGENWMKIQDWMFIQLSPGWPA